MSLRPDRLGQPFADQADEDVGLDVAERVVDGLEVVEVEEQDGGALGVPPPAAEGVLQAVDVEGAIGQARERVVEGLPGQLLLERLPPADVVHREHEAADAGIVAEVRGDGLHADPHPVELSDAAFEAAPRARLGRADDVQDGACVLGRDQVLDVRLEQVGGGIAERRLDGWADVADDAVRVEDDGRVRPVAQQRTVLLVRGRRVGPQTRSRDAARYEPGDARDRHEHDRGACQHAE